LLNTTSRGSFLHISSEKARSILDQILATESDNILEVEPQVDKANSLPDTPSTSATPCSELQKEGIPFPDFMLDIEPDLFTDFGNVLKYLSIKKPQKHFEKPLDRCFSYRSTSGELISVISNE
jgi:hypothetical protein